MFAVDVCRLPETGGSTFVLVAALFLLVAGVVVTRWVRRSAGRLSVVAAPLVLLSVLAVGPAVVDPCAPATTTTTTTTTTTLAPFELTFTSRTTADGLGEGYVFGVFVDGSTVYAGTAGGLSISTDGGATFTTRTEADGLGSVGVKAVVAVGSTVYAGTYGGLSISTDGGATFTKRTTADGLGDN